MQFQSLKLGDPSLFFASTNTARLPFQFPTPIQGAYAILQRASFERTPERGSYYAPDPDLELAVLEVSVVPLFDGLQSKTSGEVQIHFSIPGPTTPFLADLIHAEVEVLVIGV